MSSHPSQGDVEAEVNYGKSISLYENSLSAENAGSIGFCLVI